MARELDVDEARSEATFRFKVDNISSIKDPVLSETCIVRNLPWRIKISPHFRQLKVDTVLSEPWIVRRLRSHLFLYNMLQVN